MKYNFYSNYFIKVKKPKKIKPSQIKVDKQVIEKLRQLKKASKQKPSIIKYIVKITLKYNIYFYKVIEDIKELSNIKDIKNIQLIDTIKLKYTKSIFKNGLDN